MRLDYERKVIFTTAHDQYAVSAFELGALDHLLNTFGGERMERVMRRARAALNDSAIPLLSCERNRLIRPLSRLFVRDSNRIVPIALASLERGQGRWHLPICARQHRSDMGFGNWFAWAGFRNSSMCRLRLDSR
jgi:hypothetical protein